MTPENQIMLGEIHADVKNIKEKLDCHITECVTQKEFAPVRNGFIGTIVLVMGAVGYSLLSLIGLKHD